MKYTQQQEKVFIINDKSDENIKIFSYIFLLNFSYLSILVLNNLLEKIALYQNYVDKILLARNNVISCPFF